MLLIENAPKEKENQGNFGYDQEEHLYGRTISLIVLCWKKSENKTSGCPFFDLVSLLRPYTERQVTIMRSPISPETQVALTLYHFSDEGRLQKVANSFGLSRSVCSIIIRRVSSVITTHLGPAYIKLPMKKQVSNDIPRMCRPYVIIIAVLWMLW